MKTYGGVEIQLHALLTKQLTGTLVELLAQPQRNEGRASMSPHRLGRRLNSGDRQSGVVGTLYRVAHKSVC
jgi:hypothetical protein